MNPTHCRSSLLTRAVVLLFYALSAATVLPARADSFTNLLNAGMTYASQTNVAEALKTYIEAAKVADTNANELCVLTKYFCDLMYATPSKAEQKDLAARALNCSLRAIELEPTNALAHICAAVCYAKNFPFSDNQTRVNFSRQLKLESEKSIELDPKQDVAYYLLGRWHVGAANMGLLTSGVVSLAYGGLPKASNEDAIKNFKLAISIAPNRIIHHFELGKVYFATGQKDLAREEFKKCAGLKPLDRDDVDGQEQAAKELAKHWKNAP